MKRLPRPLCSWCGNEYRGRSSSTAPPLCQSCHVQLGQAPTKTLIQIIAYLAAYNQVALRLLIEGHELIREVASGSVPPARLRGRKPPERVVAPSVRGAGSLR